MTVNLLKRLESLIHAFRLHLGALAENIRKTLDVIEAFRAGGGSGSVADYADNIEDFEADDDELERFGAFRVGARSASTLVTWMSPASHMICRPTLP
jgi:hypothetical protein